ncbi:MAG: response regulator transcription factor [Flavobacteriaceae bacterium]|jgi:two-component system LytT family response regulator|nr:response regulator transcription factor [Flavobacteriaceae bacterium]
MSSKYKALIVEDVKTTSDYILDRIEKLCPDIGFIDQVYDLEEAALALKKQTYDIVFLDIQMPTGTSFDLLKQLSEEGHINFEIIFITGESAKEYTLSAIKYSALDFLYKPLDDSELIQAVHKASEKLRNQNYNRQVQILLEHIGNNEQVKSHKIAFYLHNGIVELVDIHDIVYLKADGVISYIYLENGKQLTTNKNLGYYKDMLVLDYDFKQISNSLLVNTLFIKRYNHHELLVSLTNGEHLYASKRFGKELKDSLESKKKTGGFFSWFR